MPSPVQRPTLNLFAIPFGLAGLGGALDATSNRIVASEAIAQSVWTLALGAWLTIVVLLVATTASLRAGLDDLRHPVLAPFVALGPIVAIMLAVHFLGDLAPTAAIIVSVIALAASAAFAGWFTAQWMLGGADLGRVHPGYLLPTVASSLVSAVGFAHLGLPEVAYALAGIGIMFWLLVTGLFIARSFAGHPDLGPLTPTLAIHAAPAPVLGLLWFALDQPGGANAGAVLLGLTVFGLVIQLFLVPRYVRLTFTPAFWSFTFSSAAVASFAARWVLYAELPVVLAALPVAATLVLIGGIAIRHLAVPATTKRQAENSATPRR